MCPQEKFVSPNISFANLVSFVWLLFYFWTGSEHVKRRKVLSTGHFWASTSWSRDSRTFMFSPKKKKKKIELSHTMKYHYYFSRLFLSTSVQLLSCFCLHFKLNFVLLKYNLIFCYELNSVLLNIHWIEFCFVEM